MIMFTSTLGVVYDVSAFFNGNAKPNGCGENVLIDDN